MLTTNLRIVFILPLSPHFFHRIVRDQAFKAIDMFIKRLEKLVLTMVRLSFYRGSRILPTLEASGWIVF